jgi:hypothetical protein
VFNGDVPHAELICEELFLRFARVLHHLHASTLFWVALGVKKGGSNLGTREMLAVVALVRF